MSPLSRRPTAAFLAQLFGWDDVPHFSDPPFGRMSEQALLYVGSSDLEADVQKARQLGARVVAPITEVTGSGRFALIEDPHGSRIALWA